MTWQNKVDDSQFSEADLKALVDEIDARFHGRLHDHIVGRLVCYDSPCIEESVFIREIGKELKTKVLKALGCTTSTQIDPKLAPQNRHEMVGRLKAVADEVCREQKAKNDAEPNESKRILIFGLQEGIKNTFLGLQNDILTDEHSRF